MDTKARNLSHRLRCIGSGNQQLARHAADTRAGGAILAAFDNHGTRSCGFDGTVCRKASRPGTNDRYINLHDMHIHSFLTVGTTR